LTKKISEAITQNSISWERIKENGEKNQTKRKYRNIMEEALQKEKNWKQQHFLTRKVEFHTNSTKIMILLWK
jgi:hypothetical protein